MVDPPRALDPSDAERLDVLRKAMWAGGAQGESRAVGPIYRRDRGRADVVGTGEADAIDARESKVDVWTVAGTGTSTFTLTFSPVDDSWNLELNGVRVHRSEFSVSGQTLTITSPTDLFKGAATQGSPWDLEMQYDYYSGVPTVPSDLPLGMRIWIRATDLGSTNDTVVTSWPDQSGLHNDGTATLTGADILLKTGQAVAGGVGVYIDTNTGAGRHIRFGNVISDLASGELFLVIKQLNDPAIDGPFNNNSWGIWGNSGVTSHYPFTDGTIYEDWGSTVRHTVGNPTPALDAYRIVNIASASGEWTYRLDGSSLFTTATNTVAWQVNPELGRGGGRNQGYFAEMIVYDRALTTTERAQVMAYLTARHGL